MPKAKGAVLGTLVLPACPDDDGRELRCQGQENQ